LFGHFQICNRGTLGGSMAHADPAAEYPTVALALDATMEAVSPHGRRDIAAADFFTEGIVNAVHRAAELIRSATSAASRG
jgi:aerobic carbon-monoxide dehydrogenase medium subunit